MNSPITTHFAMIFLSVPCKSFLLYTVIPLYKSKSTINPLLSTINPLSTGPSSGDFPPHQPPATGHGAPVAGQWKICQLLQQRQRQRLPRRTGVPGAKGKKLWELAESHGKIMGKSWGVQSFNGSCLQSSLFSKDLTTKNGDPKQVIF